MDNIILNKVASLERCLKRIQETYALNKSQLETDHNIQDVIVLNLQRACQISIDLGMHVVRIKKLGLPKESKEVFVLLAEAGIISRQLAESLQKMVGFRNIAVHEYSDIDYGIVKGIIEQRLEDFKLFAQTLLKC